MEIWRYGARAWGSEQAFAYAEMINAAFELLRERPEIGSARIVATREVRRWVVGRHAILFYTRGTDLRIVRVLHTAMDEPRHLA